MAAVIPVLAVTLPPAGSEAAGSFSLCILCGDFGTADAIRNVLLFVPLGAALAHAGYRLSGAALLCACLSVLIETSQMVIPGRDPTLGDIVFNTGGGALGAFLYLGGRGHLLKGAAFSWIIACGAAVVLAGSAWLLQPALPKSTYVGQWTPNLGHLSWYRGRVLSAEVGGMALPPRRLADPDSVRRAILNGAELRVEALAGPAVTGLGSLFSIYDDRRREIILVGPRRSDLVLRYRTRARAALLDSPDLQFTAALGQTDPGDSLTVTARLTTDGAWLSINESRKGPLTFSVGSGWSLIFYPHLIRPPLDRLFDLAWIAALFAVIAVVNRSRGLLLLQAGGVIVVMIAAGWLAGMVTAGLPEVGAALAGLLTRRVLARAPTLSPEFT